MTCCLLTHDMMCWLDLGSHLLISCVLYGFLVQSSQKSSTEQQRLQWQQEMEKINYQHRLEMQEVLSAVQCRHLRNKIRTRHRRTRCTRTL